MMNVKTDTRQIIETLEEVCKTLRVNVKYGRFKDDAAYWFDTNTIKLKKSIKDGELIANFLHEIGHVIDEQRSSKKFLEKVRESYQKDGTTAYRKKDGIAIYKCEVRAWRLAKKIAINLNIKLGRWFYSERAEALRTYKESI